jgi:hypothetical protein
MKSKTTVKPKSAFLFVRVPVRLFSVFLPVHGLDVSVRIAAAATLGLGVIQFPSVFYHMIPYESRYRMDPCARHPDFYRGSVWPRSMNPQFAFLKPSLNSFYFVHGYKLVFLTYFVK